MPYKKQWFPNKKKRADARIGNTSAWPNIERAKKAGVAEVQAWKKNKTIESAAAELHCWSGVNSIKKILNDKIHQRQQRK